MEWRNLADLRRSRRKSQREVALALGITPAALCRKEKGERGLHPQELLKLADLYQVPADVILRLAANAVPRNVVPETSSTM